MSVEYEILPPMKEDLLFFFEIEGRHVSVKAQEVVDHLASFPSGREEIS